MQSCVARSRVGCVVLDPASLPSLPQLSCIGSASNTEPVYMPDLTLGLPGDATQNSGNLHTPMLSHHCPSLGHTCLLCHETPPLWCSQPHCGSCEDGDRAFFTCVSPVCTEDG